MTTNRNQTAWNHPSSSPSAPSPSSSSSTPPAPGSLHAVTIVIPVAHRVTIVFAIVIRVAAANPGAVHAGPELARYRGTDGIISADRHPDAASAVRRSAQYSVSSSGWASTRLSS